MADSEMEALLREELEIEQRCHAATKRRLAEAEAALARAANLCARSPLCVPLASGGVVSLEAAVRTRIREGECFFPGRFPKQKP